MNTTLLRVGLLGNATLSTLCAVALFAATDHLAPHVGAPPWALAGLGGSLLVFVALLVWQATRPRVHLLGALITSAADLGWVLASGAWIGFGGPSQTGVAYVLIVAAGVGLAAATQLAGIRRAIRETDPARATTHRYGWETTVAVPAADLWPIVEDLGGIHRYSEHLATSFLRPGPSQGRGTVRECHNRAGERWSERVTAVQPGRSIALRFQAEEPGFPFPVAAMEGGWVLDDCAGGCRVRVWWSLTPSTPALALLLLPLMGASIERGFPRVLERMAAAARGGGAVT